MCSPSPRQVAFIPLATVETGQLGINTSGTNSTWTPVPLPGPCAKIVTTGGGSYGHTLWLLQDGRVFSAGYGAYGQLGTGSTSSVSTPTLITTLSNVVDLWTGGNRYATCFASCQNGDFYAWGYNGYGRLGLGNTTQRTIPVVHPLSGIAFCGHRLPRDHLYGDGSYPVPR